MSFSAKIRFFIFSLIMLPLIFSCSAMEVAEKSKEQLQLISAGHTGCLPGEIEINVIEAYWNNSGLWKAVCKGNTYVCSFYGNSENISANCAPEAK